MNLNKSIFKKIEKYQIITIFGHVAPDGDCYGSQTGLMTFLKEVFPKKQIYILGSGFKKAIPIFDEMDVVDDETIASSLAIVVDVSDLERIEDQRVMMAKEIVKFDHHIGSDSPSFAKIQVSKTSACSACQMVGEFILDNQYRISKDVGERLFLGMVTDSGRFLYLSSSDNTFLVLNEIMKAKIDFQKIFDTLYESDDISTKAKGYIMYNFKASQHGVAYIVLNKETLKDLNIDYNYASTMVNCLSGMKGYPIWVSFAENEDGVTRVELRSKKYNVQEVAIQFGGGGHQKASGCRLEDINDYEKVVDALDKIIE